jgi:hypothetical protein
VIVSPVIGAACRHAARYRCAVAHGVGRRGNVRESHRAAGTFDAELAAVRNPRLWRALATALAAAALSSAAAGCGSDTPPVPTAKQDTSGVTVSVRLIAGPAGTRQVKATFTPDKPGFHVYSVDLPDGGVQGMGIPTRLRVEGGLTASGAPVADKTVMAFSVTGTSVTLPVYPDGPVTLTLPVVATGNRHADIVVSYGACSPSTCLMPVTDERIPLDVG